MVLPLNGCGLQRPCALSNDRCGGVLQSLTEEEWKTVRERCIIDGRHTYDSTVMCKHHVNEWLHRYKPTSCAACPRPLSASSSMQCPEWMRQQLNTHHGAFVHVRPCYYEALAARKQRAADTRPVEVQQENEQPKRTFQIDVSQHNIHTCNNFHACTHTHKYVLCLPVCADRLGWRNPLETTCIQRRSISAD